MIYAGDGDDYVVGGDEWYGSLIELQNGDDTVFAPQLISRAANVGLNSDVGLTIRGGAGDDTWIVDEYGVVDDEGNANYGERFYGGEGNDYILGTHKVAYGSLFGNEDHDIMIAGDGVTSRLSMMGNDGDDKVYGSSSAAGDQ